MEKGKSDRRGPVQLSALEYRALISAPQAQGPGSRKSKFGAKRLETDEGVFDSKGEYGRYLNLRQLERLGQIRELKRQVKIPLVVNGRDLTITDRIGRAKRLSYIADFTYYEGDVYVVEDFKGFDTPVSRLKRALVEAIYALTVRVTRR